MKIHKYVTPPKSLVTAYEEDSYGVIEAGGGKGWKNLSVFVRSSKSPSAIYAIGWNGTRFASNSTLSRFATLHPQVLSDLCDWLESGALA